MTNITAPDLVVGNISRLLALVGQPARIQILIVIGVGEVCVCHLEAVLGMRQASISQHLMVLRKAGLVTSQREGRNMFYRLTKPEILQLLEQATSIAGIPVNALEALTIYPVPGCTCPQCNPDVDSVLACRADC